MHAIATLIAHGSEPLFAGLTPSTYMTIGLAAVGIAIVSIVAWFRTR